MTAPVRRATKDDFTAILDTINAAAEAYRGVIPADCWHEPYMPESGFRAELVAGVAFSVVEVGGEIAGVMGIQDRGAVYLIRHSYVRPPLQHRGVGSRLLVDLTDRVDRPVLVGTWAAATWAIRFYERHGFALVPEAEKNRLLATYWTVPERQVENSVVLADRRYRTTANGDD